MMMLIRAFAMLLGICAISGVCHAEKLLMDHRRDAVSLAGTWQMLLEHGDRAVWKTAVAEQAGPWEAVEVPGSNLMPPEDPEAEGAWKRVAELHKRTECVWVRRSFALTEEQAARDAVLKWGGIRFGASAWINGTFLEHHAPVCPNTVLLPEDTLRAGENRIVLKILGWDGLPRSESGYPLVPTGGATQPWGSKAPAVYQDIWIEFYDRVYLRHVLSLPDVTDESVTFRITLDGIGALPRRVDLVAEVREAGSERLLSAERTSIPPGEKGATVEVTCPVEAPRLWTPQTPHLYEGRVRAAAGGRPCDDVRFTFGFREITIEDGHFRLNGEPLWLRGSNLVNEWLWGEKYNENVKQYLIDEARVMNLNVFRTHTQPLPALWADVADRHGMMIMAETPLLYNYGNFDYTPEELEVFHENALIDARGWITKLWNHPSIVMWVLSNESRYDREWESGPLYPHARSIDPTRPCMRTGDTQVGTPDVVDVHTCFNMLRGGEGTLIVEMTELMAEKDPGRPLTNTEYMNRIWDPTRRWLGRKGHPDYPVVYARCGAEHTEAMRRLQFDCLLPYMYAGWTRLRGKMDWREEYPTPMAAALHSAMAPVLASLDVFDRNYAAGGTVEVPLVLINETHGEVSAELDLYVTPRDPVFVPDAQALDAAVWHEARELTFAADSLRTVEVSVPVPEEGNYFLAAVLTREGDRPVVSQRVLRAIDPRKHAGSLDGRRVAVFGADEGLLNFLERHGCSIADGLSDGRVEGDVVLIGDAEKLTDAERRAAAGPLREFAESGGRIVVLDQAGWPWKELCNCRIGLPEFRWRNPVASSRVHRYEGADHPMLRDIPKSWLWRWNGLPGEIVGKAVMDSPALERGRRILWSARPEHTAVLSMPTGEGEIVFSQLEVRARIDPAADAYDPVAERVLVNLLRP